MAGSSGTPTGSVDIYDIGDNTDLGLFPLTNGQASDTLSPATGSFIYLGIHSGNSTYARSSGYALVDVVAGPSRSHIVSHTTLGSGGIVPLALTISSGTLTPLFDSILDQTASTSSASQQDVAMTVGTTATTATESDLLGKKKTH